MLVALLLSEWSRHYTDSPQQKLEFPPVKKCNTQEWHILLEGPPF